MRDADRRAATAGTLQAPRLAATRRVLVGVRVERERVVVRLRAFAVVFAVIQSFIQPGESAPLTWGLNALLALDWLVTDALLRRAPERNLRRVGWLGFALDMAVAAGVLANNTDDAGDPVFLIVVFLSLEAALRWGRWGGILGGLGSALIASAWGWTVVEDSHMALEHATMRFFVLAIVGGITGGLVERLDAERARFVELAYTDPLTGLANRTSMQEVLGAALQGDQPLALVYLDLDGFKAVNDHLGHSVGDALLAGIATRMQRSVREGDTVVRLGGDEFVVIVTGESVAAIDELVGRLHDAVVSPVELGGRLVCVGVSCGAVLAQPGDTIDTLLRRADDAMYRAKRKGPAATA